MQIVCNPNISTWIRFHPKLVFWLLQKELNSNQKSLQMFKFKIMLAAQRQRHRGITTLHSPFAQKNEVMGTSLLTGA